MLSGEQAAPVERRQSERLVARFSVRCADPSLLARAISAFSLNVSPGGVCLKTRARYAVGDRLRLTLFLAEEQLELDGAVAWARGDTVGVRFERLDAVSRERLERLIAASAQVSSVD